MATTTGKSMKEVFDFVNQRKATAATVIAAPESRQPPRSA